MSDPVLVRAAAEWLSVDEVRDLLRFVDKRELPAVAEKLERVTRESIGPILLVGYRAKDPVITERGPALAVSRKVSRQVHDSFHAWPGALRRLGAIAGYGEIAAALIAEAVVVAAVSPLTAPAVHGLPEKNLRRGSVEAVYPEGGEVERLLHDLAPVSALLAACLKAEATGDKGPWDVRLRVVSAEAEGSG